LPVKQIAQNAKNQNTGALQLYKSFMFGTPFLLKFSPDLTGPPKHFHDGCMFEISAKSLADREDRNQRSDLHPDSVPDR
jgi:hypothetical protein